MLGIDAIKFEGTFPTFEVLCNHISLVRNTITGFRNAKAIIVVEENYGNDAEIHDFFAANYGLTNYEFVKNKAGNPGFHTSNPAKRSMVFALNTILTNNMLFFHRDMITSRGASPDAMRDKFIKELMGIKRRTKPGRDVEDEPREYFSGKQGNQQDDIPWAFMFCLQACSLLDAARKAMGGKGVYGLRPVK